MKIHNVLLAIVVSLIAIPAGAQQIITSEYPVENGGFAWDQSACSEFAVFGEPGQNSATVYKRNGESLEFFQNITKNENEFGAQFAHALAISGDCDTIIFGAPLSDGCGGEDSGLIELWQRSGPDGSFEYSRNECGPDTEAGDEIGQAVAINYDGNKHAFSSYKTDSVYSYTFFGMHSILGPVTRPEGVEDGSYFGFSLCYIGDKLGSGAPLKFHYENGVIWFGGFYVNGESLDPMGNDRFGYKCTSFGPDVVVGATTMSSNGLVAESPSAKFERIKNELDAIAQGTGAGQGRGKAVIYHIGPEGNASFEGTLNPVVPGDNEFATGLGMWSGKISVGSPYWNNGEVVDAGRTDIFRRHLSGWAWDGVIFDQTPETLDRFGWSAIAMPEISGGGGPFSGEVGDNAGIVITGLDTNLIFADGLETGDTLHWSSSVP